MTQDSHAKRGVWAVSAAVPCCSPGFGALRFGFQTHETPPIAHRFHSAPGPFASRCADPCHAGALGYSCLGPGRARDRIPTATAFLRLGCSVDPDSTADQTADRTGETLETTEGKLNLKNISVNDQSLRGCARGINLAGCSMLGMDPHRPVRMLNSHQDEVGVVLIETQRFWYTSTSF